MPEVNNCGIIISGLCDRGPRTIADWRLMKYALAVDCAVDARQCDAGGDWRTIDSAGLEGAGDAANEPDEDG